MKSNLFTIIFIVVTIFSQSIFTHVRKFSQHDFNKWLDVDNYVIALFCSSASDQECNSVRQKMNTLSHEMIQYTDLVFGYVDQETDPILINQYHIQNFPVIKFFPYNNPSQTYLPKNPIKNIKEKILEIRNQYLKTVPDTKLTTTKRRHGKKSPITEIDGAGFDSTAKNSNEHVLIMLHSGDCKEPCQVVERVARIFEEETDVAFYKLNIEKTGPLRHTFSFAKDPTIYWYPKQTKDGFIYGGALTFKMLVEYINDHAGLSRNYNGDLKSDAGRIAEIDQIIQENIYEILQKTKINKVINSIEKKSTKLPHAKKYIDYYLGILKEIRKGANPSKVLIAEQDFLNKKLSSGRINNKENEEWRKYYNIISAFVDFAANYHQDERAKRPSPRKVKTPLPNADRVYHAELKEDPKWKHQSHHDEL